MSARSEEQWLTRQRRIDAERRAQAILRRRHATKQAVALIVAAKQKAAS